MKLIAGKVQNYFLSLAKKMIIPFVLHIIDELDNDKCHSLILLATDHPIWGNASNVMSETLNF